MSEEPKATLIARSREQPDVCLWKIGENVYRANESVGFDSSGLPLDKRWECKFAHWQRYRSVFSWAVDVPAEPSDSH